MRTKHAPVPRHYPTGSLVLVRAGARETSPTLPFGMSGLLASVLADAGIDPLCVRVTVEVLSEGPPVRLATVDGEHVSPPDVDAPASRTMSRRQRRLARNEETRDAARARNGSAGTGALPLRKRPDPDRSVAASRGWERRREREEFAAVNIPPDLLPLWEREKGRFTDGTPDDRARAFLEWAEAHEKDAVAARDRESGATLAASVATRTASDLPREGKLAVVDAEIAELLAERAAIAGEDEPC